MKKMGITRPRPDGGVNRDQPPPLFLWNISIEMCFPTSFVTAGKPFKNLSIGEVI